MAIMDGSYLIGKIIEINYTNSRALLLSDLNSKIPVMLLPDRIQAVVSGTGKNYGIIEYSKEKDLNNTLKHFYKLESSKCSKTSNSVMIVYIYHLYIP